MAMRLLCGITLLGLLAAGLAGAEENWPQWRGPDGTGFVHGTGFPTTWSDTEHIAWKVALPSWSGATPAIWGDRIFVTSPSKVDPSAAGTPEGRPGGPKLLLLCLSKKDGKTLWEQELDAGNMSNSKQNASSPSPVTDGAHVWAVTGTGAVVALTMDGKAEWKHSLQAEYSPFGLNFGYASSPLLLDGKLIVEVLHGLKTKAPSYVVAFDAASGNVLWHVERPTDAVLESRDAYTTPVALRYNGKTQFVIVGGDCVTGHDPETGKEIWRAGGLNPRNTTKNRIIVSPVAADGLVFANSSRNPLIAIRAGGEGDITASGLAWRVDDLDGPDVPTPAYDGTYLYVVNDRGVVSCLEAKTGKVVWGPERTAVGVVSTSPIVADGKLYVTNESGITTVLAAGPAFKVLATNTLKCEGKVLSSFAVSGKQLFLRTATDLYCIGK